MIVGCYSIDLYCDHPEGREYICTAWPGQFNGRTEAGALRRAKAAKWRVDKNKPDSQGGTGRVLCPVHGFTAAGRAIRVPV